MLKSNWSNRCLALIGRKYSTWIYIIHPIFITIFSVGTDRLGIKSSYNCVVPIVVYCATIVFLFVMRKIKMIMIK